MHAGQSQVGKMAKMGMLALLWTGAAHVHLGCATPQILKKRAMTTLAVNAFVGPELVRRSVVVKEVNGDAQKLTVQDGQQEWSPVKVGDRFKGLTVLRTGMGSPVTLVLGDGTEVRIGGATKMGIADSGPHAVTMTLKHGTLTLTRADSAAGLVLYVDTPAGRAALVGRRGVIAFVALYGLLLRGGPHAWQREANGGNAMGNNGDKEKPREKPWERELARRAEEARRRSMSLMVARNLRQGNLSENIQTAGNISQVRVGRTNTNPLRVNRHWATPNGAANGWNGGASRFVPNHSTPDKSTRRAGTYDPIVAGRD